MTKVTMFVIMAIVMMATLSTGCDTDNSGNQCADDASDCDSDSDTDTDTDTDSDTDSDSDTDTDTDSDTDSDSDTDTDTDSDTEAEAACAAHAAIWDDMWIDKYYTNISGCDIVVEFIDGECVNDFNDMDETHECEYTGNATGNGDTLEFCAPDDPGVCYVITVSGNEMTLDKTVDETPTQTFNLERVE